MRIRSGINDVLLGMRASAAISKNWPSIVRGNVRQLLKDRSKEDGNRRRYRLGRWKCESCEQSECDINEDDEYEGGDDSEEDEGDGEGDE
jgi:hypothetical protein